MAILHGIVGAGIADRRSSQALEPEFKHKLESDGLDDVQLSWPLPVGLDKFLSLCPNGELDFLESSVAGEPQ